MELKSISRELALLLLGQIKKKDINKLNIESLLSKLSILILLISFVLICPNSKRANSLEIDFNFITITKIL